MNPSATVLLVEDDKSMLNGMRDLLENFDVGYDLTVLTAGNGLLGLEQLELKTPHLIVSDIMMPQMDGYQFLDAVRKNRDWLHIPFIFLTAKGDRKEVLQGRLSGANLYLTKPFNSAELLDLIRTQLDKTFQLQASRQTQTEELKKGLLQILNHEFRTPLTYVTAYSEMLADSVTRFDDDQNFQDYLLGIQAGCMRLTRLVNDLITVLELRTGEFQAEFIERATGLNNIHDLLKTAVASKETAATRRNILIHIPDKIECPPLFGDPVSLTDIFIRLLDNAIKFTPISQDEPKHIRITTQASDTLFQIAMQDEGLGLPANLSNQIFDLFFQYNRQTLEQQGAGLGLTIIRGILDMHHGWIDVNSQEDRGSTFTVSLPIYNQNRPLSKKTTTNIHMAHKPSVNVLVVEDDPFLLIGLQELLEIYESKYRFSVQVAENGVEGLRVLQQRKPDLIISDIMMPQMGGYEFLERVRENPEWLQIPFIFLSAKGERRDIHQGRLSGVDEYITKPYDSDELLNLVTTQLDRYFAVQNIITEDFSTLKRSILQLITPDFRLPLSTVSDYSNQIAGTLDSADTNEHLKDSLEHIRTSSNHLSQLVEDFIALAELKTGEAKAAYHLRAQPISDIVLYLSQAIDYCQPLALAHSVPLNYPLFSTYPALFGDSVTIQDTIRRLIQMGLTHFFARNMVDKQAIDVYVTEETAAIAIQIIFAVSPPLDQIIELRDVLTNAERDPFELTKFGPDPAIARGYIALNDGHISIDNSDNNNCTITVSLPIYQKA